MLLRLRPFRPLATAAACATVFHGLAMSALASPVGDPPPPATAPPATAPPAPAPPPAAAPPVVAKSWGQLKSDRGQTWVLTKPTITIGSEATSDVVLTGPTVAPQQCRLTFANGNASIEDLGSKSGTLVAGTLLKPGKAFTITNAVEIDPGAVTLQFSFLERGPIGPTSKLKVRKPEPKYDPLHPTADALPRPTHKPKPKSGF